MRVLAIIPARGGSKGIPRKNLQLLAGKPLIAHTIGAARAARLVSRVVVSTDDPEITATAMNFGAEVVQRPTKLGGDSAASESALLHTLTHLERNEAYRPDVTVFLQCTSPFTTAEDIDATIQALTKEQADSALAVTAFHYFLWRRTKSGNCVGINHDKGVRPLRQEREPQYLETGAVYVMRTDGFRKAKHRFFGKTAFYVMPHDRCLEIDEPNDLRLAELKFLERQKQERVRALPSHVSAVVFDFDGVFTDNRVFVFQDGREAVLCNRSDGLGLARLRRLGLQLLVLSSEKNPVVSVRCNKLHISCRHGVEDKLPALMDWLHEHRLKANETVFVGNDTNDLACLRAVGCGVSVNDADPEVKSASNIVLSSEGGHGAVRELVELILHHEQHRPHPTPS